MWVRKCLPANPSITTRIERVIRGNQRYQSSYLVCGVSVYPIMLCTFSNTFGLDIYQINIKVFRYQIISCSVQDAFQYYEFWKLFCKNRELLFLQRLPSMSLNSTNACQFLAVLCEIQTALKLLINVCTTPRFRPKFLLASYYYMPHCLDFNYCDKKVRKMV